MRHVMYAIMLVDCRDCSVAKPYKVLCMQSELVLLPIHMRSRYADFLPVEIGMEAPRPQMRVTRLLSEIEKSLSPRFPCGEHLGQDI